MFAIRPLINPANRYIVDAYLRTVWKRVSTLTLSLAPGSYPSSLRAHFRSYVHSEEERLRDGLKTVQYHIDGIDTLSLIVGPGRIEKVPSPI